MVAGNEKRESVAGGTPMVAPAEVQRVCEDGGSGAVCTGSETAVPGLTGLPSPGQTAGNAVWPFREDPYRCCAPAPLS